MDLLRWKGASRGLHGLDQRRQALAQFRGGRLVEAMVDLPA
jgi:hypothetical protein